MISALVDAVPSHCPRCMCRLHASYQAKDGYAGDTAQGWKSMETDGRVALTKVHSSLSVYTSLTLFRRSQIRHSGFQHFLSTPGRPSTRCHPPPDYSPSTNAGKFLLDLFARSQEFCDENFDVARDSESIRTSQSSICLPSRWYANLFAFRVQYDHSIDGDPRSTTACSSYPARTSRGSLHV